MLLVTVDLDQHRRWPLNAPNEPDSFEFIRQLVLDGLGRSAR